MPTGYWLNLELQAPFPLHICTSVSVEQTLKIELLTQRVLPF